jgi:integrase
MVIDAVQNPNRPAANVPKQLNMKALERIRETGRHAVGNGLYLQVATGGARSWLFRYQQHGRRHDMGLGPFPTVTLAMAREAITKVRQQLHRNEDPLATKRAERAAAKLEIVTPVETFNMAAESYIIAHSPGWKNARSADQWRASLATYAAPHIGTKNVADVDVEDLLAILRPIWTAKNVTATRVRGRIESILDAAKVRGLRSGENPARWKGHLALILAAPARVHKVKHHAALPVADMPTVMAQLASMDGIAPLALRFLALTVGRATEIVGGSLSEIDGGSGVWTIPAGRMKADRDHRVPLSPAALAVLTEAAEWRPEGNSLLFPSNIRGVSLSLTSLSLALRRAGGGDATVHGLRSTFRDWTRQQAEDRELAELSLAHTVGDATEQAYARDDLLDRRRGLLQRWATFATSAQVR